MTKDCRVTGVNRSNLDAHISSPPYCKQMNQAQLIEAIKTHPYWACNMDDQDVINRTDSVMIASTGFVLVRWDGAWDWYGPGVVHPIGYAKIPTEFCSVDRDEALRRLLNGIEEAYNDIVQSIQVEAFDDGRHGRSPQLPHNETYMQEWHRGQEYAPYALKFPEARATVMTTVRFLSSDDQVKTGCTYYITDDRIPVKVQSRHPKGGWICLHQTGDLNGKQRQYQTSELGEIIHPVKHG